MEQPKLILNGKEHSPKRPTMKVWRAIVEHDSEAKGLSISDILSHRVEILALIYDIDKEQIEAGVEVSDVLPAYNEAAKWILSLVFEKLETIPNAEAGTDGK